MRSKTTPLDTSSEKKGHICPPSNAIHPSDRWESLFVYSFICKFTNLRGNVEGLLTPMDFEEALLSKVPNTIMTEILSRFVRNLRPQTRNVSPDQISATVAAILLDFLKSSERTVFWNDDLKANIDPFQGLEGGFFTADWDLKLKILRQLVELQLCHGAEIKANIDRAWGVVHNKHKKLAPEPALDPSNPNSQENLQLLPIGQDVARKRYWVADGPCALFFLFPIVFGRIWANADDFPHYSVRLYLSTNPWKITATFQSISSTREEYVGVIEKLKAEGPSEPKEGEKRTKLELAHLALVKALETRLEVIDAEIARIAKARRKIEQKQIFNEQAELRQTRLRRTTRRLDYAQMDAGASDDEMDEYKYQDDELDDEEYNDNRMEVERFTISRSTTPSGTSSRRDSALPERRRSSRAAAASKRVSGDDAWSQWRGERRSTRLGAPPETQLDEQPLKRARTEDSTISTGSAEPANGSSSRSKPGGPSLKATEVAVEAVAGKKKSRFWYYAVEPVPGQAPAPVQTPNENGGSHTNGIHSTSGDDSAMMNVDDVQPAANGTNGAGVNGYEGASAQSTSPSFQDT
ncbi:hypothetical protein NEOLEDRAFT_1174197 [Neolentinus lepideus HHB14362 ss-1]|uniref:WHIM1 domain-containing protein n=1 Tax=Neolentinus lepideus HHB14362 ss-1 TaxID=1314782 RepID=A0A165W8F1_9AGAM|nr:hypothetical protein NEOLEDRAFT_1174197 [Neolentinus lepideus HHB14362 ss-1]